MDTVFTFLNSGHNGRPKLPSTSEFLVPGSTWEIFNEWGMMTLENFRRFCTDFGEYAKLINYF